MNWWLFGVCLFSHDERVRERDEVTGRLILRCPRCQDRVYPLKDQSLGTPIPLAKARVSKWWEGRKQA